MDVDLTPLKTFAASRPVMFGAPAAAVLGVVLGLVFRVGAQTEPSSAMESYRGGVEQTAEPIAWPAGKVPDYVIGTDFLAAAVAPRAIQPTDYVYEPKVVMVEEPPESPPPPVVIATRPPRDETRWASTRGDILDVHLPEDIVDAEPTLD